MPSIRPPGNKFEWRRAVAERRGWADDASLWSSVASNSGANELVSDPDYGLRVPDLDVDDYTQGNNIDVNLTDVRIVAKWNPGNDDFGEINDAAMSLCMRESPDSLRHLTAELFFDVYGPEGGDDLNIGLSVVTPGIPGFLYQSTTNPEWNNYNGTGVFGSSADQGGSAWLYEWEDTPAEQLEAGIRPNTDYWMVAQAIGNTITIEHWLTDPELGTGSPMVSGTITFKAPTTPRPGYETSDIDRRPVFGAGVFGTVGIGYVQVAGRTTYGIKEFRVFDMSGGRSLLITIAGLSIYTSDYLGSGGPTTKTIDGTEDVFAQPITVLGAYSAEAHILESVGSVAPTFSIHNLTSGQLRWQIYDAAGNRSGMPNGVYSAGATGSFDLASKGPGRYFLVVSFDSAPHTGSYEITAGPAGQLVAPDTTVEPKVEVFPP